MRDAPPLAAAVAMTPSFVSLLSPSITPAHPLPPPLSPSPPNPLPSSLPSMCPTDNGENKPVNKEDMVSAFARSLSDFPLELERRRLEARLATPRDAPARPSQV